MEVGRRKENGDTLVWTKCMVKKKEEELKVTESNKTLLTYCLKVVGNHVSPRSERHGT